MVYFDAIRTPERGATGAAARPPSVSPVVAAKEASIDKDRSRFKATKNSWSSAFKP